MPAHGIPSRLGAPLLVLTIATILACSAPMPDGVERAEVGLPLGDVERGRQAWVDLRCFSCHLVSDEPDLPTPVTPELGPELGYVQTMQSAGRLATSIIVPSHALAYGNAGFKGEGDLSRMGSYNDVMTIQQLVDLIAFIQSLPER